MVLSMGSVKLEFLNQQKPIDSPLPVEVSSLSDEPAQSVAWRLLSL